MKHYIGLLILLLCISGCNTESMDYTTGNKNESPVDEQGYIKGFMRIKLTEEPTSVIRSTSGNIATGVKTLDSSLSSMGITSIKRTFPYDERFEERTRKEGMHLWYDIRFSENQNSTRAAKLIAETEGIEIATPVRQIHYNAVPSFSLPQVYETQNADTPFNDPQLPKQWNYNNPGTETWQQKGADIRLFNSWTQYNGNPNIIVAIVDGGIALEHPDLKANLWTNSGEIPGNGIDDDHNGYIDDVHGYNFVSNSPNITPHRHGTHVAGTVAAVNNNGEGVCGIAGGDGTINSSVKLMSCQIFQHPDGNYFTDQETQNTPAAIKYAADNGALICQNSWGYTGDINPADKAAIDYFVKYAGCDKDGNQLPESPMKGGIVIFATNNNNSSNPSNATPADYEKVLGVAALGPDYKKGAYSNYGNYIDLSAPGGTENGVKGIYSTTLSQLGNYEYRYGASMASPHVSGVAALVLEKYGIGKKGFTASQLEEILLTTAYDINKYNPQYVGKLGYGCVDASAALAATLPESKAFVLVSNPITNDELAFRVNKDLAGKASITIKNSAGAKVYSKSIETERYNTTVINISKLSAGYYHLVYLCNGNETSENFIKY